MTAALLLRAIRVAVPDGAGERVLLDEVDLQLRAGEVTVVTGRSGSGKSTLLSLIAGLYPHQGSIEWNDKSLAEFDPGRRRQLTLVFQRDTVLPWATVEKNVGFGLRFLNMSKAERQERISRLLTMAGLMEFRHARPHELSGGMRRRVALLTGVAPLPNLLLLDEPFAGLDEPTRVGIHRDLLQIVYQTGTTVVLVTHDLGEAISLSDRVCVVSSRPARIVGAHTIYAGHDRDVGRMRQDEGYQRNYSELWGALWAQIDSAPRSEVSHGAVWH